MALNCYRRYGVPNGISKVVSRPAAAGRVTKGFVLLEPVNWMTGSFFLPSPTSVVHVHDDCSKAELDIVPLHMHHRFLGSPNDFSSGIYTAFVVMLSRIRKLHEIQRASV